MKCFKSIFLLKKRNLFPLKILTNFFSKKNKVIMFLFYNSIICDLLMFVNFEFKIHRVRVMVRVMVRVRVRVMVRVGVRILIQKK